MTIQLTVSTTEQEVFDFVVNHLAKQGRMSFNDVTGRCAYRDPDGNKCAAGCLIPDDKYSKLLEGFNWRKVSEILRTPSYLTPLIQALQQAHDSAPTQDRSNKFMMGYSTSIDAALRRVAREYKLDATSVDNFKDMK